MSDTQAKLVEWLESLTNSLGAYPISVKIGKTTYEGAAFWRRNTGFNRDYVESGIYLLGDVPASYKRSRRVVYNFGSSHEWYVACWATKEIVNNPEFSEYHPFGIWFQLRPWRNGKIDEFSYTPYKRIPAQLAA